MTDVYGAATMPQSVDFRWQTGIAPDWLAFGNVKWVNWSVLEVIAFCPTSTKSLGSCGPSSPFRLTSLDLMFQDGWTVAAGVGHKFNDQFSFRTAQLGSRHLYRLDHADRHLSLVEWRRLRAKQEC
jgi:long-chain fatty acid transport protein